MTKRCVVLLPMQLGIVELKWLRERSNLTKYNREQIEGGILPRKFNDSDISRYYLKIYFELAVGYQVIQHNLPLNLVEG